MFKFLRLLRQLFCKHEWEDECSCGRIFQKFCLNRKKYGNCIEVNDMGGKYYCKYYFQRCYKCFKHRRVD